MRQFPKPARKNPNAGFSLVEISIVLIVVGLLIAGVMKGQSLIESARLHSVHSQIDQYRLAFHAFETTYGALPGDYAQASQTIKADLQNGDGDGHISNQESNLVWKHLATTGLIPDPGGETPPTKLGGMVMVVYNPDNDAPGHWFRVQGPGGAALFTPKQALALMQKTDSVRPKHGYVQVRNGSNTTACLTEDHINIGHDNAACVVLFKI